MGGRGNSGELFQQGDILWEMAKFIVADERPEWLSVKYLELFLIDLREKPALVERTGLSRDLREILF